MVIEFLVGILLVLSVGLFIVGSVTLLAVLKLKAHDPQEMAQRQAEILRSEIRTVREELRVTLMENRSEMAISLEKFRSTLQDRLDQLFKQQSENSEKSLLALGDLKARVSESVSQGLRELQEKNEAKLEQMRLTVDEKLQKTLDTRLSQSFETVTRHLLDVQKGLTEMQTLAQDVGGLKKALTNVKVRGIMGEAQLAGLLEQYLSPEQFLKDTAIKPRGTERVEFAVKLPGIDEGAQVLLPIDSKFPIEDYQRLQDAFEVGNKELFEAAGKAFENRLYAHAKEIRDKYISPPHSTDFALMFLPFESIFAEALRRPHLFTEVQRLYRVTLVGPTTLSAFLNSLQVGFKTLAISRQSGEVWRILGAVKTEFGKFGEALAKVQTNLENASTHIHRVTERAKQMERKLDKVATLPSSESLSLLPETDPESLNPT